jgi:hypothetical protein
MRDTPIGTIARRLDRDDLDSLSAIERSAMIFLDMPANEV